MISLVSSFLLGSGLASTISTGKNDKADYGWKIEPKTQFNPYSISPQFQWNPPRPYSTWYPNKPTFVGKQTSSDDEPEDVKITAEQYLDLYNSLSEEDKRAVNEAFFNYGFNYNDGHINTGFNGGWKW